VRRDSSLALQSVTDLRPKGLDLPRVHFSLTLPDLDAILGGGLPCGAITEIFGAVSSGRTALAQIVIATVTLAGECAAWIDLPNAFDPNGARAAGIDLDRMLWVSPTDHRAAFRAVEHVRDAGGFRVVVLDLDHMADARSVLPTSGWLRLGRAAAHRNAAIVVITASHAVGTFAALSLEVRADRRLFVGESGPCPVFKGAISAVRIERHKFGPPIATPFEFRTSIES
jgi:hypothetical protein